jgi:hypothetical protein
MPLTINLLHEEQSLLKLRKRDPLKLGLYALGGVAVLFVAYYALCLIGSVRIKNELQTRQAAWARQEPRVTKAQQQDKIANDKLGIANLVSQRIDNRFYWAPVLADLLRTVTPNVQIITLTGSSELKDAQVTFTLDGLAAGAVPRAAAEQFRTGLNDVLNRSYKGVSTSFRSLDETASSVPLAGKQIPTARFSIEVKMDRAAPAPVVAAAPARLAKHP